MIVLAVEDLSSSKKFKEIVIKYCMHENIYNSLIAKNYIHKIVISINFTSSLYIP